MRPGPTLSLLAVVLVGAVGVVGIATSQGKSRRVTPHEDLPAPNGDKVSPMIGSTGNGANPGGIAAGPNGEIWIASLPA